MKILSAAFVIAESKFEESIVLNVANAFVNLIIIAHGLILALVKKIISNF